MDLTPLLEAVRKITGKTPVTSALSSADLARLPVALRESSQFSARVESARVVQSIQDRMQGLLTLQREQLASGKSATYDRSSFIDSIRDIGRSEGLTPTEPGDIGTIRDITSIPRLGLIYDMQQARAQEFARWKVDQTEGALMLYPAQEFIRIEDRNVPRNDWPQRFAAAAAGAGDDSALRVLQTTGRMVALKTSGLWAQLSRFGTPWPPFDWGSGMGLEDIDYDQAQALGLVTDPELATTPADADFTDQMQASVRGLSESLIDWLKKSFGDQVAIDGDTIRWVRA